jgi:glycosyltransferase involved in cell wall biosynthesis
MKILIATGIYPPDIGGPASYSKALFDELPKKGIEALVLSFGEVRHYPKVIRHFAYFFKTISRARGCDIIYAQDPVSVGLPAVVAAKILRKKFILKVVGDYAWEQGVSRFEVKDLLDEFSRKFGGYGLAVFILKRIETYVAKRAEKIVVPSKYLKQIVSNWGIDKNKITVVYNSFDGEIQNDTENVPRERIIFSAGRLVPWKGFLTLIALMPRLIRHFPEIKLIIAGEGSERRKLERAIKELSLSSSVFLAGPLSQEKLFKYIRSASVFVLNTAYEGFSHQLLEVMALGTPVVTTDIGGNPEVIENEKNGLLVKLDDRDAIVRSVEKILLNEAFSGELTENARRTVALFNRERMINETVKILQR